MPPKRNYIEHSEQRDYVTWFRLQYSVEIIAIPNGEARSDNKLYSMLRGKRLKAEGVVSGVWDLMIPTWYLWIEMKADKKKKLSKNQEWFSGIIENHYHRIVGNGFSDAVEKTKRFVRLVNRPEHKTAIGERIWLLN